MPRISFSELALNAALNDLARDFKVVASEWHDEARVAFERDFIDEFLPAGRSAVGAMTDLSLLLMRVVRECGD